ATCRQQRPRPPADAATETSTACRSLLGAVSLGVIALTVVSQTVVTGRAGLLGLIALRRGRFAFLALRFLRLLELDVHHTPRFTGGDDLISSLCAVGHVRVPGTVHLLGFPVDEFPDDLALVHKLHLQKRSSLRDRASSTCQG